MARTARLTGAYSYGIQRWLPSERTDSDGSLWSRGLVELRDIRADLEARLTELEADVLEEGATLPESYEDSAAAKICCDSYWLTRRDAGAACNPRCLVQKVLK